MADPCCFEDMVELKGIGERGAAVRARRGGAEVGESRLASAEVSKSALVVVVLEDWEAYLEVICAMAVA